MTYKPEKGSRQPVVLYDKDNKAIDVSGIKELSSIKIDTGKIAGDLKLVKDNQGRLYGKYGEAWIPVKVDSEGRPIISQGPAGTEPWPVQLSGTAVTHEVLLDAVSVAPLAQTNQINLNITNEKKVVLLVWNDLDTLRIWSSTPWRHIADADPHWGSLYPPPSNFSATPSYNPHVFVWIGTQYQRLGLTDIKEAFDIALPPVSPSFIRVSNDDPDETLTITIRILRYWR